MSSAEIKTYFLPFVSARHPQKYDPIIIPPIGAAVNHPLSADVIWKSETCQLVSKVLKITFPN